MIRINKTIGIFFIFCSSAVFVTAQEYKYRATLDSVKRTGFYQINITPELSAHVKTDFSDLRVTDQKGKWVPHIIKSSFPHFIETAFREFPILKNEITDSGKSVLIIENRGTGVIINKKEEKNTNELLLFIKNASVGRYASLSGSNDNKHWFIVAENILLLKNYETTENYFVTAVKFSNSDYKYFKLIINNEKADPLNIIKAGSYFNPVYMPIFYTLINPAPAFYQKDSSDGKTYIKVKNSMAFHIDKISINAGGSNFFERTANLYVPQNDSMSADIIFDSKAMFIISSKRDNSFDIKKLKEKLFYLVIDNKDNPPLKINSIRTEQQINKAITYLEKGKQYYLLADNAAAVKPDYDLEVFKDSIPENIDTLSVGQLTNIEIIKPVAQKSTTNRLWLWPSIIAAILMLGFLTWKLISDMKKNDL